MNKYIQSLGVGLLFVLCACGEDERCYKCTLNATSVDVCTSNYKAKAERDNVTANSLDEYLDLVKAAGFDCVQTQ